jgi:Uncharacterized alpha/beta hydrolase domain (DUF2235)
MATPREQAGLNDANASGFSEAEPSATQTCPMAKGIILGVFFDGTGNNKYTDGQDADGEPKPAASNTETNVSRLWKVYQTFEDQRYVRDKLYIIGIGATDGGEKVEQPGARPDEATNWVAHKYQQATGAGGKQRLNIAYRWVKAKASPHKPPYDDLLDVYGFSRGASLSRTFVNLVNQAMKKEITNLTTRFLGVFDTVGSWGDDERPFMNEGLDSGDARSWAHFTARFEHREHFPLTELSGADKQYAGVHSDVGGGYADEVPRVRNSMAFVTCNHMWRRSVESHVDITAPPTNGVNIDDLYARSEKYGTLTPTKGDTLGASKHEEFMSTYVHDNTSSWKPWNFSTDDDQRVVIRVTKFLIGSPPPNFTWRHGASGSW